VKLTTVIDSELSLELEAERGGLYIALESDFCNRQIDYFEEMNRAWWELEIECPQMQLLFDYSDALISILSERIPDRLRNIYEGEIDEFITYQIWRSKVARGLEAFACPTIGKFLINFEWLKQT